MASLLRAACRSAAPISRSALPAPAVSDIPQRHPFNSHRSVVRIQYLNHPFFGFHLSSESNFLP